MEPNERPPRRAGGSGGAGIVAGLLLIGLLVMGLAAGVSFVANAQQQADLEALSKEEHGKRIEAEQHEAAAKARADAEHERALAAESARAEHEARQIEALHAEEEARAPGTKTGGSPPGLVVGKSVQYLQQGKTVSGKITGLSGSWVEIETRGGSRSWINFDRVDRYELLLR